MPPKKDAKKGPSGAGPAEVDLSAYVRELGKYDEVLAEDLPAEEQCTGMVVNVETLFPDWNIEVKDIDWSTPVEETEAPTVVYPSHIASVSTESKSLKAILGFEDDESAAPAGKKDAKKGKGAAEPKEVTEPAQDEQGRALPRMFLEEDLTPAPAANPDASTEASSPDAPGDITSPAAGASSSFEGFSLARSFRRVHCRTEAAPRRAAGTTRSGRGFTTQETSFGGQYLVY